MEPMNGKRQEIYLNSIIGNNNSNNYSLLY